MIVREFSETQTNSESECVGGSWNIKVNALLISPLSLVDSFLFPPTLHVQHQVSIKSRKGRTPLSFLFPYIHHSLYNPLLRILL